MTSILKFEGALEPYPLVVDLDWTLIEVDSLFESFASALFQSPSQTLFALAALRDGRAAFKRQIARIGALDVASLPLRKNFVKFLEGERARGRELHLVTAADQSIADAMAERTGIFSTAVGSSQDRNLKGAAKSEYLQEKFPDGFSYAGDSAADLEVWRVAKSGILVGVSPATKRAVDEMSLRVESDFPAHQPAEVFTWLQAMRWHQWSKNLLLFVPLVLAHKYTDLDAVFAAISGFVCLCVMASGTYLINDIKDIEADRAHTTKRDRPIAAGRITIAYALAIALAMIATALIGAAFVSLQFLALLILYLAITSTYTAHLKHVPMVDIFVLGFLYGLRVYMGMVLVAAPFSNWLLAFSLLFFVSLSACKRHVELVRAKQSNKEILGRGYRADDAPLTLAFGVSSGVVATLILFLYLVNDAQPAGAYTNPDWLWLIGYCVFFWLARIWFLAHRGELDADPVAFAIRDKISLGLGAVIAIVFVCAVI